MKHKLWRLAIALSLILPAMLPAHAAATSTSCNPGRNGDGQHYWSYWNEWWDGNEAHRPYTVTGSIEAQQTYVSLNSSTASYIMIRGDADSQSYAQIGIRNRNVWGVNWRDDFIEIGRNGQVWTVDTSIADATDLGQFSTYQIIWDQHEGGGSNYPGFRFYRNRQGAGIQLVYTYTMDSTNWWWPTGTEIASEEGSSGDQMPGVTSNPVNFNGLAYGLGLGNSSINYGSGSTTETSGTYASWDGLSRHVPPALSVMSTWDKACP